MSVSTREDRKVDVYARFLPELIIEKVFEGKLADSAGLEEFACAVMFADISGFTPLAESFAAEGAVGAEKLTATLNDYFSDLVGIIQAHGGDVVKFAGDAVLAIWKDGSEDTALAYASWRAAQCGLAIQDALRDYTAGDVKLSLRVAIGAGSVNIIHVGGVFNRWEFLVAGKPLEQVGSVSDDIEPGFVGVSSEAWDLMVNHSDANPQGVEIAKNIQRLDSIEEISQRRNRPDLELLDSQESLLRGYLPAAVTHRLDVSLDAYLGELRRLTILFVNLPDIDYQTPVETAQEIMIALQESCYRYEGSINKLSVDDKGVSLLAALGLPPMAHEDDPDRGIKAALTINARLKKMGIRSSIGVSSGRVYCGVVGSAQRREYTIMGDSVNLSARLMQNAQGGVLCDLASFNRASQEISFSESRFIKLKGKANLEEVYQPLSMSELQNVAKLTPIVGREVERKLLKEKLEALINGDVESITLLEAESGYGKSRVKDDFLEFASDQAVTVYQASADAIERSTLHHTIRGLLFNCLGFNESTPAEQTSQHLRELLADSELNNLLPLLSSIIPLEIAETPFTLQLEGEVRAAQTSRIIVEVLKKSQIHPQMVIVVDDVHWLDSASWSVLLSISQEISPLMLLLVSRPVSEPTKEMTQMMSTSVSQRVLMDRMPAEDIITLVCSSLGVDRLPKTISELILERADGHPYFSEEMGYALRDNDIIEIKDGRCTLKANGGQRLENLDIPESIEGIITSRIDRLTPSQALTIKVASVIGRSFSLNLLQQIHPVSRDKSVLREELDECGRLHLTPQNTPHPDDPGYIFKHMITQEVSYSLLLRDQSKKLHEQLALFYEENQDERSQNSLLAYHWELAEQYDKALHYLMLAVDEALDEFSNSDALALVRRALMLTEKNGSSDDVIGHLLGCQGQALFDLGRLEDAVESLHAALDKFGAPVPSNSFSLVLGIFKELFLQYRFAKNGGNNKVDVAKEREYRLIEAANAYNQVQVIYYYRSDNLRTIYTALRGSNLGFESGKVVQSLVRTNVNLTMVFGIIPNRRIADYYLNLSAQQLLEVDHPPTTAWVDLVGATYLNGIGEWQRSEKLFNKALLVAEGNGDESLRATILTARSKMLLMWGRFPESLEGFESIYVSAIKRDDPRAICWSVLGQARNHFRLGKFGNLRRLLDEAAPLLDGLPFNQRMDHLSLSALLQLHEGDLEAAEHSIADCVKLLSRPSQTMMIFACTQLSLAILEIKRRRPSRKVERWWRATSAFMKTYAYIFPIGEPVFNYHTGIYEEINGNHKKATRLWLKSLELSLKIEVPYITITSLNALRDSDPEVLNQYQAEYDKALTSMGAERVANPFSSSWLNKD